MPTFIKTGFWDKAIKGYKEWLNLDQFVEDKINSNPSALPYKVYTVILNQTGTNAPVATVLENSIGDIVWGYVSAGVYSATLNGAFTLQKTTVQLEQGENQNNYTRGAQNFTINSIVVRSFIPQDGLITNAFLEIRVYN
jgi:hypothetical protein